MKKTVKKSSKKQKLDKFGKFDAAEKEIKEAEDAVYKLSKDFDKPEKKELLIKAQKDLEKAEAEVEEVDESCF